MPRLQQSPIKAKISISYIFTLHPNPPWSILFDIMCEKPLDVIIVLVWLLYHHLKFRYCFKCIPTVNNADRLMIETLDAPRVPFIPGA